MMMLSDQYEKMRPNHWHCDRYYRYRGNDYKLYRFLKGSIGQPWNIVYSKACHKFDDYTLTLVKDYVRFENEPRHTCYYDMYIEDGILKQDKRKSYHRPQYEYIIKYEGSEYFYYNDQWWEVFMKRAKSREIVHDCFTCWYGYFSDLRLQLLNFYGVAAYCHSRRSVNKKICKKLNQMIEWRYTCTQH